jgi:hypothetical protein
MMASVLAILSLLFPPASIFSSSVIALVTLRKGASDGAIVLALATTAGGLLGLLLLGNYGPVVGFLLLLWLPIWLLATLLRMSCSLALTLVGGVVLGLIVIAGQFAQSGDPVSAWRDQLEPLAAMLVEAQIVENGKQGELIDVMARWMPGVMAAGYFLQSMISLLLARWWQALLYNPGGFRSEFHQLRLPKTFAYATAVMFGLEVLLAGAGDMLTRYVLILLLMGWFFQGLALVHGTVDKLKMNSGWLIGIYLLLLIALPHAVLALAMAGFTDAWFDFRARLRSEDGPGETG